MDEERDELLALGAAGALTPEEAVELERLLAADPQAAAEYAAMLDDVTALAESVAEAPPARLRAAVLEAVAAEAQVGAAAPPPASELAPPLQPPPPTSTAHRPGRADPPAAVVDPGDGGGGGDRHRRVAPSS